LTFFIPPYPRGNRIGNARGALDEDGGRDSARYVAASMAAALRRCSVETVMSSGKPEADSREMRLLATAKVPGWLDGKAVAKLNGGLLVT
jgi:hypothetical protein